MKILRGQVWMYQPSFSVSGSIQKGTRPVIIISNNIGNKFAPTVIVVPCTTQCKKGLPTHAYLNINHVRSTALAEQITTVASADLVEYKCMLMEDAMARVDKAVGIAIGLIPTKLAEKTPEIRIVGNASDAHKSQVDKFYAKYPQTKPSTHQEVIPKRNSWTQDTICRFLWDCGELSPAAVREKYHLSDKSIEIYYNRFTKEYQNVARKS